MSKDILKRTNLYDVLLPDHPHVRPIRRAVDLFRDSSLEYEWQGFKKFLLETIRNPNTSPQSKNKALQLLAMVENHHDKPISTKDKEGKQKKVFTNGFRPFRAWLDDSAPDWYSSLLQLSLEKWSLEEPAGDQQSTLRKAYRAFANECGFVGWENHTHANKRIQNLNQQIKAIPVPRQTWTATEMEFLGGRIPSGSLASMLTDLPPYKSGKILLSVRSMNGVSTPLEKAAYDYITSVYKDIAARDILGWPFRPFLANLVVQGDARRVLFVFRGSRSSVIPRINEAYGKLTLMTFVNETPADEDNSLYLATLKWDRDRVLLFDASRLPIAVRTWANGSKTRASEKGDLEDACTYHVFEESEMSEANYNLRGKEAIKAEANFQKQSKARSKAKIAETAARMAAESDELDDLSGILGLD